MNKKSIKLLYRSFEKTLTPAEERRLEKALAASAELRSERNRIIQLRKLVTDGAAHSFRPFFAEKVLHRIRAAGIPADSFFDSLVTVFRPVAIAITILITVLLSYNLFKSENKSFASALAEPEIKLEQALDPTLAWVME